jgi:hypothetical protein
MHSNSQSQSQGNENYSQYSQQMSQSCHSQRSDLEVATQGEATQCDATMQDAPDYNHNGNTNIHNKPKAWARLVR